MVLDKEGTVYNYNIPEILVFNYNNKWIEGINTKWNDSQNFIGLLLNVRLFINGMLQDTPEHRGELEDKDPEYIQRLLQLNAMGVLTTNGQEFKQIITRDKVYMQREYLNFAYKPVSKQALEYVINKFNNADLFYYAISYNDKKVYQTPYLDKIDFDNSEIWVSRTLQRKTNTFENHTHILEPCDLLYNDMYFNYYANDFYPGTVFFQVWSISWEEKEHYMIDQIINCLLV
jgi:hypothetical protein